MDITRDATDFRKHYSGIRMQQGRVLTDDDYNEGARLDHEALRRSIADIIGPAGSADNGFHILPESVTLDPLDFKIEAGTLYLGGMRLELENEYGQNYRTQDDWLQGPDAGFTAPIQDRVDLVYVEAYQEPVTAVEDSEIREVALGGPDTSARVRIFRRVHILALKNPDPSCSEAWQELAGQLPGTLTQSGELVPKARLTVTFPPGNNSEDLCSPEVAGGYLGAENQAIRVQLVDSGHLTWGFDNAAPLYLVQISADRKTVTMLTDPKDQHHWPLAEQVVEILPWGARLSNGEKSAEMRGHFSKIQVSFNQDTNQLVLVDAIPQSDFEAWWSHAGAVQPSAQKQIYCFMRVWNRGSDRTSVPAIPFTPGQALDLGNTGLRVTLNASPGLPGDYWILAARPQTPDQVVPWDFKTGRPPHGVRRFYAPLALIRWKFQDGKFHEADVRDCRAPFVPLTSRWWWGGCSIVVAPVPGWERLLSFFQPGQDVSLCFQVGDYQLDHTLVFETLKSVKMVGAGPGTRIIVSGHETAFLFNGCESVIVRDLHIESRALKPGLEPNETHLNGAVTFIHCSNVQVSDCYLACPDASGRRQSCLTVRPRENETTDRVLIERNRLLVGAWQTGLLLVNADHALVKGNHISMHGGGSKSGSSILPGLFVGSVETVVLEAFSKSAGPATREVKATKSDVRLNLLVDALAAPLIRDFAKIAPKNVASAPGGVEGALSKFARGLAAGRGTSALSAAGREALEKIRRSMRAGGQGIVVAGTRVGRVQVLENEVDDMIQGIHIGVSNPTVAERESVDEVLLAHNCVNNLVPPWYGRDRHGIFVGNARSIRISDTVATLRRTDLRALKATEVEGIRVHGVLGPFLVIRQSNLTGFAVGVRVVAINQAPAARIWLVAETLATGALKTLVAPAQVERERVSP